MAHSTIRPWLLIALALLVALMAGACVGQMAPPAAPTDTLARSAPTDTPVPAAPTDTPVPAAPTEAPATAVPWTGLSMDLAAIFPPPAEMRDLMIRTCTNCHGLAPLVGQPMTEGHWRMNKSLHLEYVSLRGEELDRLYEYLTESFNPDTVLPDLPQELLGQWPAYY